MILVSPLVGDPCSMMHLLFLFNVCSFILQSMSGIEVDPEITALFNEIKLKSTHKYAIFKIENKKTIVVDIKGDPKSTEEKGEDKICFDEMKEKLTKEPRYILYDFSFKLEKDSRQIKKLAFIFW